MLVFPPFKTFSVFFLGYVSGWGEEGRGSRFSLTPITALVDPGKKAFRVWSFFPLHQSCSAHLPWWEAICSVYFCGEAFRGPFVNLTLFNSVEWNGDPGFCDVSAMSFSCSSVNARPLRMPHSLPSPPCLVSCFSVLTDSAIFVTFSTQLSLVRRWHTLLLFKNVFIAAFPLSGI